MTAADAYRSFWQRRLRDPLLALLRQGLTPDRLAVMVGVGSVCSLFPFLGFTSLLNLIVGWWLKLNHPLLQALNQLLGPLQLVMILVYVRLGERIWRAQADPFTLDVLLRFFRDASLGEFLHRFGWAGVHAATAWLVSSPLLLAAVYYPSRMALRKLASAGPARA